MRDIQTVVTRDIQTVVTRDIQTFVTYDIQTVVTRDIQTVVTRDIQTFVTRDIQTVVTRDIQTVVTRDIQTVLSFLYPASFQHMEQKPTDVAISILFVYCCISTCFGPTGPQAHRPTGPQASSYSCSHNHWFSICIALVACSVCCGLSW